METAKSIYLGGRKINANDPQLRKYSYRELGLTCPYCNEPVYLRAGTVNRPHFAHYPDIDIQKYEECLLRQRNQGTLSFSDRHWWEDDGRNQRFELFQEHFMYIVKASIPSLNVKSMRSDPTNVVLTDLQYEALKYAQDNKDHIGRYVRFSLASGSRLERDIIGEAFNYLLNRSSKNIFQIISEYVLRSNPQIEENDLKGCKLCEMIIEVISKVKWLHYFERITSVKIPATQSYLKKYNVFAEKVKNTVNQYVYLDNSRLWLGSKSFCDVGDDILIAKLDISRLMRVKVIVQKESIEIVDVENPRFLNFAGTSTIYASYKKILKGSFSSCLKESLRRYVDNNQDERFRWEIGRGTYLTTGMRNSSIMRNGEADISLVRADGSSLKFSRVFIKTDLFRSKVFYKFGNFLSPDKYFIDNAEKGDIVMAMISVVKKLRDTFPK